MFKKEFQMYNCFDPQFLNGRYSLVKHEFSRENISQADRVVIQAKYLLDKPEDLEARMM